MSLWNEGFDNVILFHISTCERAAYDKKEGSLNGSETECNPYRSIIDGGSKNYEQFRR
jgi:hypothetical protein